MLSHLLVALMFAGPSLLCATGNRPGVAPARLRVPVLAPADVLFGPQDVRATVGGAPAKVLSVAGLSDDLIILTVLDLADDLSSAQHATTALMNELDRMPPNVLTGLLRAQDGLRVLEDPTADRAKIRTAVEALAVSGRAGFLDSVETAVSVADAMMARSPVRVAIVYITDSEVTNYQEDFTNPVINSSDAGDLSRKFPESLIQAKIAKLDASLRRRSAPVFIVHTTYRSDRLNAAYLDGLRQLALTTGGTAVVCRSLAEIPGAVKDVLQTVRTHRSVTLELPKNLGRGGSQALEVQLSIAGPDGADLGSLSYRSQFSVKRD